MPPIDPNNPQIPTTVRPISRAPAESVTGTPYDFIMNPSIKPPKKSSGLKGGPKLAYIAGGGVIFVIILFVVLSLSSGGGTTPGLVSIAQQQAEIARVADLHYSEINDAATKNFVINTQLSVSSAESEYLQYLTAGGVTIKPTQIALGINTQTDAALDAAKGSGALDSTVKTTLQTALESYQQTIQTTYSNTKSAKTKTLLKSFFDQATVLLEQSKG